MTPTELAFHVGKSSGAILRYERGEAIPPLPLARRIAELLNCSVDDLWPAQTPTEGSAA